MKDLNPPGEGSQKSLSGPRDDAPTMLGPVLGSSGIDSPESKAPQRLGDYELLGEIARGGMGIVYRAKDTRLNRTVAIKTVLSSGFSSHEEIERFRVEAEAAANLNHPNIVPVHEVGVDEGRHYFSMQLVEGPPLSREIGRFTKSPAQTARLIIKVARAVHHAHQRGIIHRDLKPGNILLDATDEPFVTDFGLAKRVEASHGLTVSGEVMGTPNYMAPEQATGQRQLSIAVDVYALGAILYHLLAGKPPFHSDNSLMVLNRAIAEEAPRLTLHQPNIDQDLESICLKCLEKEPTKRYGSAEDLANDLERYLNHEPIRARPITRMQRALKWARRRPAIAGLAVALLLTMVAGVVVVCWQLRATEAALAKTKVLARSEAEAKQEAQRLQVTEASLRKTAEILAESMRKRLYAVDIREANRELDSGQFADARERLDQYKPQPGQQDLRGFEWFWVHQRLQPAELKTITPPRVGGGGTTTIDWSPDGRWIAYADRLAVLLQEGTGGNSNRLAIGSRVGRHGVRFSPDNHWLAVAAEKGVSIWDTATWEQVKAVPDSLGTLTQNEMGFSPDSSVLAYYSANQGVVFLDTKTWETKATLPVRSRPSVVLFSFSPDGRSFALYDGSPGLQLFQFPSLNKRGEISFLRAALMQSTEVTLLESLIFTPDSRMLACGDQAGRIQLWPVLVLGDPLVIQTGPEAVNALRFSRDGKTVLFGRGGRAITLLNLRSQETFPLVESYLGYRGDIALSPAGDQLASVALKGSVQIVNLKDDASRTFRGQGEPVGVWFKSAGQQLAIVNNEGLIERWPFPDPATLQDDRSSISTGLRVSYFRHISASADGTKLAIYDRDYCIDVFDLDTRKHLFRSKPMKGIVKIQLSPNGEWLALAIRPLVPSGTGELALPGIVRLWHLSDMEERTVWAASPKSNGGASTVTFSADSRLLAADTEYRRITIWSLAGNQPPVELEGPLEATKGGYGELWFSPDGQWLAARPNTSNQIQLWNLAERKISHFLGGHQAGVRCMAFSPDNLTLASGGEDKVVKLWNVKTGAEVLSLAADYKVNSIQFASDGTSLAAMVGDGIEREIKVWRSR